VVIWTSRLTKFRRFLLRQDVISLSFPSSSLGTQVFEALLHLRPKTPEDSAAEFNICLIFSWAGWTASTGDSFRRSPAGIVVQTE
jgi:hypothetical protein